MITLLHNARIQTLDDAFPSAASIAIDGEKILAVGPDAELADRLAGRKDIQPVDLERRIILPGLTDAHIHLEQYALGLQKIDCETDSRDECLRQVADRARQTRPDEWVLGHGWNQNNWPEGFGSATDLDAAAPGNPVFLTAKSLHAGWANSAALRLAGVGPRTPDPPGGRIGRDNAGQPNGILFESAMEFIYNILPEQTVEGVATAIREAQGTLWSMGLTGAHDFDRQRCFAALQILHEREELRLRVIKSIPLDDLPHAVALGLRTGFGDDWLRTGPVKVFSDGALGPHTAAMLQPYEGDADNLGMLLLDGEELFERGRLAVENGLSLAVHAIGDRANHEVLNAYQQLREYERGLPGSAAFSGPGRRSRLRHRIEHVQLIHPDDAGRLGKLGITASMQPIHASSDMLMADRYWGKRASLSYAWRTQLQHGARLAFGSDAPVESPNPFWGLHSAVTRCRQDGSPGPQGWYPEQRLSLDEALRGYTSGAAYAAGLEDRLGRLASGYLADLIVLESDPYECNPEDLYKIRPAATMAGGMWVYGGPVGGKF